MRVTLEENMEWESQCDWRFSVYHNSSILKGWWSAKLMELKLILFFLCAGLTMVVCRDLVK